MEIKTLVTPTSLPQGKLLAVNYASNGEDVTRPSRPKKYTDQGLVGFVNIGNSCYMNATLQALSNCPPFCQYLVESYHPSISSTAATSVLSNLLKKVWSSERHPGHLSPRSVSSAMKNLMFRGSHQQDAQEFLRCLLTQIHEEISMQVPSLEEWPHGCDSASCDHHCFHRDSMVSCDSDTSVDSQSRLVESLKNSPVVKKKSSGDSSHRSSGGSTHSSPSTQSKFSLKYSKIKPTSSGKSSAESSPLQGVRSGGGGGGIGGTTSQVGAPHSRGTPQVAQGSQDTKIGAPHSGGSCSVLQSGEVAWEDKDAFLLDLNTRKVTIIPDYFQPPDVGLSEKDESSDQESANQITCIDDPLDTAPDGEDEDGGGGGGAGGDHRQEVGVKTGSKTSRNGEERAQIKLCHTPCPTLSNPPRTVSIVSEIFEGTLESKVKCLSCKKISTTREPFQDLSLPIPGRKDIAKLNSKLDGGGGGGGEEEEEDREGEEEGSVFTRGFCTVFNYFTSFTRDLITGPPTDITDCLNSFFDTSELKGDDRYYCSNCKSFQNSEKAMSIASLPEVLCIHLKRFRFDAYFSTKIARHIRFPLSGLDMSPYLKQGHHFSHLYELNTVITHYGGAGGGHYVAFAKNPNTGWHEFNDTRVYPVSQETVLNAEGYVLFYRRSVPSEGHALRSLDITKLLPPKGTTIPSPDVCYVSRHWLHLLRHTSHPGPIFQFDYSCKHGAVHPTKTLNDARSLALPIQRDMWDQYQEKYGGGPLVQQLEICQECQELLIQLNERRKAEKDEVHKLSSVVLLPPSKVQTQEKKNGGGEDRKMEPYLISLKWLEQWKKFIHCTSLDFKPPVAIDNTPLLQCSGNKAHIMLAEEGAPYRTISKSVWDFFHETYGGGPTILTSLEPINRENV